MRDYECSCHVGICELHETTNIARDKFQKCVEEFMWGVLKARELQKEAPITKEK